MPERNHNIGWVMLNSALTKTVITLAEREFAGEQLTDEDIRNTTVSITQRGALANAPAMISAIRVMTNILATYLKNNRADISKNADSEIDFTFKPDQHSVIVNDKICVGICTEPSDSCARDLSAKNPGFTDYLILNVNSELLYSVSY